MQGVLKKIRTALRMTQTAVAAEIGISRGLWSVHEGKDEAGDHDVPPHIARSLIKLARSKGMPLAYEHLYEGAALPEVTLAFKGGRVRRKPVRSVPVEPPPAAAAPIAPPPPDQVAPKLRPRRAIVV